MRKLINAGNFLFRCVTGILAAAFLIYGTLMLWDMYRTEIRAFASYDLMKYRPNIEENEPPYLDELLGINPDTAAWLTIYNTNIDYPVMQGNDDNEYLNKNVYGDFSISGSIFMASHNAKDFSDSYTLIYGHHMANGSMFGDIMKFKDESFFDNNDKGVLIMEEKVYDIRIMGCLETDAYDHYIYHSDKTEEETDAFLDYARKNSLHWRESEYEKIATLSTCDSATTSGRTILICALTKRTTPLPDREYGEPTPHREAVGHPMAGAYWSLLNLLILAVMFYSTLKLIWEKRKNLKLLDAFLETGLTGVAVMVFIITEDPHRPIQMTDAWTPVMIILLAALWLTVSYTEGAQQFRTKKRKMR